MWVCCFHSLSEGCNCTCLPFILPVTCLDDLCSCGQSQSDASDRSSCDRCYKSLEQAVPVSACMNTEKGIVNMRHDSNTKAGNLAPQASHTDFYFIVVEKTLGKFGKPYHSFFLLPHLQLFTPCHCCRYSYIFHFIT